MGRQKTAIDLRSASWRTLVLPVIFAARMRWLKKDKNDEECDATKDA